MAVTKFNLSSYPISVSPSLILLLASRLIRSLLVISQDHGSILEVFVDQRAYASLHHAQFRVDANETVESDPV